MATETRRIALSLGADLCWPAAFEALLAELDLTIPVDGTDLRFEVERVRIRPFGLEPHRRYDMILDRLTHWYMHTREWVKKSVLLDGTYALNNPWSIQAYEKHTSYCAMLRLGLPIPKTWMVPAKVNDPEDYPDLETMVSRYNALFSLEEVGDAVGYPAFFKPYDGGGWVGVKRVTNHAELHAAYDASGKRIHHLQAAVQGWDVFVRGLGVGPQVGLLPYDPDQPLHERYRVDFHFLDGDEWERAQKTTRVINAFHGWDFNSCEMLRADGVLHPIDFANACPDSQVTSLHFHFPWLVKALLKWTIFCTATGRSPTLNANWTPYLEIADTPGLSDDEKLDRYDALAREHFQSEAFEAFCAEHLSHLDQVAVDYFGTDAFKEVVRLKVASLFPEHEVTQFTDHFFGLVQFWRQTELDRMGQS